MRSVGVLLLVVLAAACHGTTTDREDIAGSKDTALATFLQPLEAKLREDQIIPERRSRELSYFGTGYSYHPYGGHYNPLYSPYSHQGVYSPYNSPAYGFGGTLNGYGGGAAGFGGFGGGNGAFLGTGAGGYPGSQFGYSGFGQGTGAYPYGGGFNVGQSPYGGYGSQLGGYYNRGLYV
ncbi:ATP-dependent RNA helicase A-like [Anopheles marshallii]|uniref:ATP-dependent RNA helicase A-like n=1 Tax=Anopheles marshallii TaxID=1521116 RepID=UPI00237BF7FB|nr:ATP-dependent RNA helicase A-like [Anopheles marshallii]